MRIDRQALRRDEEGFTLIELLVAAMLLWVISIGFYQVLFSGTRTARNTQSLIRVSGETRVAFNRMIRETREATRLLEASDDSYKIEVDPDGTGPNDPYFLTFSRVGDLLNLKFQASPTDPGITDVLVDGVTPAAGHTGVFSYSSSLLEYDISNDGVTTWEELDSAGCQPQLAPVGNCDTFLTPGVEMDHLSKVAYSFNVSEGDANADFFSEALIRAVVRDI